jgi:hypothetical protein
MIRYMKKSFTFVFLAYIRKDIFDSFNREGFLKLKSFSYGRIYIIIIVNSSYVSFENNLKCDILNFVSYPIQNWIIKSKRSYFGQKKSNIQKSTSKGKATNKPSFPRLFV